MQKVVALIAGLSIPGIPALALAQPPGADASYVLKVDAPAAKKGEKAVARVHITPGAGYHVNKEYPTSLVFTAVPAGVLVDKMKLTGKDAAKLEEAGAEFDVAYTAAQPGKKVVSGELKFAVCSATTCDPKKSNVSFEIDVK
ncbi:MAG: hypothetical protein JWN44_5324 [Myxococcales bacterium]|nr:hypothetical protein [Myxococcales bacterium]